MRVLWDLHNASIATIYGDCVALFAICITLFHPLHIHPELAVVGLGWYSMLLLDRLLIYWRKCGARHGK